MSVYLDDGDVRLYHGDALEQLAAMPSESVQCIVTSPPFWALRDYGTGRWDGGADDCDHKKDAVRTRGDDFRERGVERGYASGSNFANYGDRQATASDFTHVCGKCGAVRVDDQIGLEATPDEWCTRLVAVFRECRRVLRNDGVMWIECGDTYSTGMFTRQGNPRNVPQAPNGYAGEDWTTDRSSAASAHAFGDLGDIKAKDLVGAPWMLAFALRADGWYLRSDTIWARPNPMPESVTDRPTKAHSYVFLLTKQARYFYDADAIREAATYPETRNGRVGAYQNRAMNAIGDGTTPTGVADRDLSARNARSVWSIATEPTPFAHFATFPQALVERCILAGTSEYGCCSACGAPYERLVEKEPRTGSLAAREGDGHPNGLSRDVKGGGPAYAKWLAAHPDVFKGWVASCDCNAATVPCRVLDPFMGSGTTALVARRLGRHAVGIELNAEYLAIAGKRLQQLSLLGGAS